MMNFITTTSDYSLSLLQKYRQGVVHSIYRKTINLLMGTHLLSLQAADSPKSPLSLITTCTAEEMKTLPVKKNNSVIFTENMLQIGDNCYFSMKDVVSHNLELHCALSDKEICKLKDTILSILSAQEKGSFELLFSHPEKADDILFLSAAKKWLEDASYALSISNWEESAQSLCRLIGLGLGLTPGGDDFLCGVLAGIIFSNKETHPFSLILRQKISESLLNTNEISRAFLQCALENQFSMAVCSLSNLPDSKKILTDFSSIGHSSGTDTLCGIGYIFQNLHYLI